MAMTSTGVLVSAAYPVNEATLESVSVERSENIPEGIMRRRTIGEGQETAQKPQLPFAEPRDIGEALRAGQHGKQRQQQHFIEPVNHLAGLPGVGQLLEIIQENRCLGNPSEIPSRIRHCRAPPSDSVDHDRFSSSLLCHELLHPITLG
jgi:hypothetical protein